MKRASAGMPEWRESSCVRESVKFLVTFLALIILVGIPLLPLFAMVAILGRLGAMIGGSIDALVAMFDWVIGLVVFLAIGLVVNFGLGVYAILRLLAGDPSLLVELLSELHDWLRSLGLV